VLVALVRPNHCSVGSIYCGVDSKISAVKNKKQSAAIFINKQQIANNYAIIFAILFINFKQNPGLQKIND
jgi:hypothetical protein